jgi:hypothetical protein
MITVESKVQVYEVNGKDAPAIDGPKLTVTSHWNLNDRVTLQFDGGEKFTVVAADLRAAIDNATNSRRF